MSTSTYEDRNVARAALDAVAFCVDGDAIRASRTIDPGVAVVVGATA